MGTLPLQPLRTFAIPAALGLALAACNGPSPDTGAGTSATQIAVLPLMPGFYDGGTSCAQASNATLALVGPSNINWSHAVCTLTAIQKTGPTSYRAQQACTNIREGTEEAPDAVIFEIPDQTSFSYRQEGSEYPAQYRYCAQSDLPEPWRDNDISDLIGSK